MSLSKNGLYININYLLPLFILVLSMMNIGTLAATKYQLIMHEVDSKGTLTFVPVKNREEECNHLINFFKDKIQENIVARAMLEESLTNGDLKIVLTMMDKVQNNYKFTGDYNSLEREIRLNVKNYLELLNASPEMQEIGLDFYKNHTLRVCIFELGNSINQEVIKVRPHHFPDPHTYALAKERAEFFTSVLAEKACVYGRTINGWNSSIFQPNDLEKMWEHVEKDKGAHFQYYVNQYSQNRILNKIGYYFYSLFLKK